MAEIRVSNIRGGGTEDGSTWANAKTNFQLALETAAAGDVLYLDEDHSETPGTTAMTAGSSGEVIVQKVTNNAPDAVLTAHHVNTIDPNATHYVGSNAFRFEHQQGNASRIFMQGISIGGTGVLSVLELRASLGGYYHFKNCYIIAAEVYLSGLDQRNDSGGGWLFEDCEFGFVGNTRTYFFHCVNSGSPCLIRGGKMTFPVGTINATANIIRTSNTGFGGHGGITFQGFDFQPSETSGWDFSSNTLVEAFGAGMHYVFDRCNIPANISRYGKAFVEKPGSAIKFYGSPIGGGTDANDWMEMHWNGTYQVDKTVRRIDGMTNGVSNFSLEVYTDAEVTRTRAIRINMPYYAASLDPRTLRFYMYHGYAGGLTDADVWIEATVPQTAGSTKASIVSIGRNPTDTTNTPVAWPTDATSVWDDVTAKVAAPVQQYMDISFTPTVVGPFQLEVVIAVPNLSQPSGSLWLDIRGDEV